MGRKRVLAGISAAVAASAIGVAPAAVAYAGGTPAPSPTGGSEYGGALARVKAGRPGASIFRAAPRGGGALKAGPAGPLDLHRRPEGRRGAAAAAVARARRPARRADRPRPARVPP